MILPEAMAIRAHFVVSGALVLLVLTHSCVRQAALQAHVAFEGFPRLVVRDRAQPPSGEKELFRFETTGSTETLPPLERDAIAEASTPRESAHEIQATSSYVDAKNAADELEEDLLACFPFTGTQAFTTDWELSEGERTLLNQWKEWRSKSIADLPEDLRFDSCHRSAIHNYFDQAIHGFLNEKAANSISRAEEPVPAPGGPVLPDSGTGSIRLTAVTVVGTSEQTASIYYVAR